MRHLPNLITLINLFAGCIMTVALFEGWHDWVIPLFITALLADFFDGMTARLFNAPSEMGKELDALADLISFGLVPGIMMYGLLTNETLDSPQQVGSLTAFLITVFTAIRLANFNSKDHGLQTFRGLPSPANGFLILGVWINGVLMESAWLANIYVLYGIVVLSCGLLVAPLSLLTLKFRTLYWRENRWRYIFLVGALIILFFLGLSSPLFIILLYIGISIINALVTEKNTT